MAKRKTLPLSAIRYLCVNATFRSFLPFLGIRRQYQYGNCKKITDQVVTEWASIITILLLDLRSFYRF